jgi:hypothetical protein
MGGIAYASPVQVQAYPFRAGRFAWLLVQDQQAVSVGGGTMRVDLDLDFVRKVPVLSFLCRSEFDHPLFCPLPMAAHAML